MNKIFLKLVMLPSFVWKSMNADMEQLKAILTARLLVDDRKPLNFGRQRQRKNSKFTSLLNMFFSAVIGILYLMFISVFADVVVGLWAYFTVFLFMLSFTLLTDFSNVLIDTRDKYILLPRPVNDTTIMLSRMLYVFIYLLRIVLPMALPGWIYLAVQYGAIYALWFPAPLLLMIFLTLFLVNGAYLLLLKFVKPSKFKEIINYLQIALSIVVFGLYYLMPQVLKESVINNINWNNLHWIKILPSYWLANTWTWFGATTILSGSKWIGLLAIIVPVVCLWITIKYLSPGFVRNMAALDSSDALPEFVLSTKKKKNNFYQKIGKWINQTSDAEAGFNITWLQTSRSRSFKMRVYPAFAYIPIYFVFLLLGKDKSTAEVWRELPSGNNHLLLLYMCFSVMLQAISYVSVSEQYKAAWVYYAAPLQTPGHVMAGSFKSLWIKYFLPFFSIISIFVVYIWGLPAILDVVLAIVNISLFAACTLRISYRQFPFSQMEQMKNAGSKTFIRILVTFLTVGVMGFSHWFAMHFWWLKIVFLILSSLFLWLVWDSFRNTSWEAVKSAEE